MPEGKFCRVNDEAWLEFEAAADWYAARNPKAGADFITQFSTPSIRSANLLRAGLSTHVVHVATYCATFHSQLSTLIGRKLWMCSL